MNAPDGAWCIARDVHIALADEVGLVTVSNNVVLEVGTNLLDLFEILCELTQLRLDLVLVPGMVLQVGPVDHRGLVSEAPDIVLVHQNLMVERHGRSVVGGLNQVSIVHLLPDSVQAEVLQDGSTTAVGLLQDLVDGIVDGVLEHRELGINLSLVLAVELNHGLHARGLAVDAVSAVGRLYIQVVVEALVELGEDSVNTGLTKEFSHALGLELLGNEVNELGHVVHSLVGISLEVGCL